LGLGLAGSLPFAASVGRAEDASGVNQTRLDDFIRMRGALDNRLVIGCVNGQYNGLVDGKITPLFGVVSAVFSRYRAQTDGYGVVEFEQAYYTDLETGRVLKRLKNPYTGETIAVPTYDGPIDRQRVSKNLQFQGAAAPPPNVHVQHFGEGPRADGEDISFVERVVVSVAAASGKPAFLYSDQTSLTANRRDVLQAYAKSVGCRTHFDASCSWRPWLGMGERPGSMTASGQGSFGVKLADLPSAWLDATAALKPGLLENLDSKLE
jgi:hypothetical protein